MNLAARLSCLLFASFMILGWESANSCQANCLEFYRLQHEQRSFFNFWLRDRYQEVALALEEVEEGVQALGPSSQALLDTIRQVGAPSDAGRMAIISKWWLWILKTGNERSLFCPNEIPLSSSDVAARLPSILLGLEDDLLVRVRAHQEKVALLQKDFVPPHAPDRREAMVTYDVARPMYEETRDLLENAHKKLTTAKKSLRVIIKDLQDIVALCGSTGSKTRTVTQALLWEAEGLVASSPLGSLEWRLGLAKTTLVTRFLEYVVDQQAKVSVGIINDFEDSQGLSDDEVLNLRRKILPRLTNKRLMIDLTSYDQNRDDDAADELRQHALLYFMQLNPSTQEFKQFSQQADAAQAKAYYRQASILAQDADTLIGLTHALGANRSIAWVDRLAILGLQGERLRLMGASPQLQVVFLETLAQYGAAAWVALRRQWTQITTQSTDPHQTADLIAWLDRLEGFSEQRSERKQMVLSAYGRLVSSEASNAAEVAQGLSKLFAALATVDKDLLLKESLDPWQLLTAALARASFQNPANMATLMKTCRELKSWTSTDLATGDKLHRSFLPLFLQGGPTPQQWEDFIWLSFGRGDVLISLLVQSFEAFFHLPVEEQLAFLIHDYSVHIRPYLNSHLQVLASRFLVQRPPLPLLIRLKGSMPQCLGESLSIEVNDQIKDAELESSAQTLRLFKRRLAEKHANDEGSASSSAAAAAAASSRATPMDADDDDDDSELAEPPVRKRKLARICVACDGQFTLRPDAGLDCMDAACGKSLCESCAFSAVGTQMKSGKNAPCCVHCKQPYRLSKRRLESLGLDPRQLAAVRLAQVLPAYRQAFGELRACRQADCRYMARMEEADAEGVFACGLCKVKTCVKCGGEPHYKRSCEDYKREQKDHQVLIDNHTIQYCTKKDCRAPTVRISDCPNMVCSRCGTRWVYKGEFREKDKGWRP